MTRTICGSSSPSIEPYLTVVFPHPEWKGRAGDYATELLEHTTTLGGTYVHLDRLNRLLDKLVSWGDNSLT